MRKTNLKAVPDSKPEKLSHDEVTLLVTDIAEVLAEELDSPATLNNVLLLASHVAGYIIADRLYAKGLCPRLIETLYSKSAVAAGEAMSHAEDWRERLNSLRGGQSRG